MKNLSKKKKKKSNAGRKPVDDKKVRVLIFVEQSKIDARKGMDAMKKHLYSCA